MKYSSTVVVVLSTLHLLSLRVVDLMSSPLDDNKKKRFCARLKLKEPMVPSTEKALQNSVEIPPMPGNN